MTEKTLNTKKDKAPHGGLEEWIEAGNRLHDRAIFDFFARLMPNGKRAAQPAGNHVSAKGRCKPVTV